MQIATTIKCPVCGKANTQTDRCTFCGTSLREMPRYAIEGQEPAYPPYEMPPRPGETSTTSYPPYPPMGSPHPGTGQDTVLAPCYAGFWIRVLAYSIDGLVVQLLTGIIFVVAFLGYVSGAGGGHVEDLFSRILQMNFSFLHVASIVLNLAYFTFFLGRSGQTPGKMLCRLKVMRTDGSNISYTQALMRTTGYYINAFTLFLGFLWVAIDPKKQGLHDKIASTYEIRLGLASVRGWGPPPGKI